MIKTLLRRAVRAGGSRLAVKVSKSMPLVGTAIAIGLVGYEIKKKGLVKGLVNTALDATPVVGVAKNVIETFTGEWLPDKPTKETKLPSKSETT
ncbi:MAG: hypothetical protein JNJ50_22435 [Acidobacteria bacterium]|nr:hypothetical protein [Acidobacteriota bacterium]